MVGSGNFRSLPCSKEIPSQHWFQAALHPVTVGWSARWKYFEIRSHEFGSSRWCARTTWGVGVQAVGEGSTFLDGRWRTCLPPARKAFFSQGRFIRPHSSLPTTREWPVSCGKKTRSQIGPRQVPACCRPPSRRLYRVLQPCVLQARSKSVNAARTDLQPQASPAPSPAHAPRSNPPYSALLRNGAPPRR